MLSPNPPSPQLLQELMFVVGDASPMVYSVTLTLTLTQIQTLTLTLTLSLSLSLSLTLTR